jgi:Tetratricopeptide repeat.
MYRQAQASIAMKNYDEAKTVLTEANKQDPDNKGI